MIKKMLYTSIITIGILGISEGMHVEQRSNNKHAVGETPISLAESYLTFTVRRQKISKGVISKVVNEYYLREYWRKNGAPGTGTDYSIALLKAFLKKMPQDEFKEIRQLLLQASGSSICETLNVKTFRDYNIRTAALHSLGVW